MVLGVSTFFLVLYLVLLVLALIGRGQNLSSRWLFLLRGFFPSWRFYDAPGYQPRLFVRALTAEDQWSEWLPFIPRASFRMGDLFFNPENNLRMTEQTLVDHLSHDLQALEDSQSANSLVSYLLAERVARQVALRLVGAHQIHAFQFELRMIASPINNHSDSVILISPIIKEMSYVS